MKRKCRYPMKYTGSLIKHYRERKSLTQLEIAKKLGYQSAQFISDIERGLRLPPKKITLHLSLMLSIPKATISEEVAKDLVFAAKCKAS